MPEKHNATPKAVVDAAKRTLFGDEKNLMSGFLHLGGMLLSIAGLVLLVVFAARQGDVWQVVTFSIYGASMILLYGASTLYHILFISERVHAIFRKIDHMMIFVLIAGTYTPICLVSLRGWVGWALFGLIWALALCGIVMKAFWMHAPRWLYTLFYILMGWVAVVAIVPLGRLMPAGGLFWLFFGGVLYTVGGVCYALKWPRIHFTWFGFHELFHIFILMGSIAHFIMMFFYVL